MYIYGVFMTKEIFMIFEPAIFGTVADWFSAIGTVGAVLIVLWPKIFKPKPNIVFLIGSRLSSENTSRLAKNALGISNLGNNPLRFKFKTAIVIYKKNPSERVTYEPIILHEFVLGPYEMEYEISRRIALTILKDRDFNFETERYENYWTTAEIYFVETISGRTVILKLIHNERGDIGIANSRSLLAG